MLEKIRTGLLKRMSKYQGSLAVPDHDISIAWLLTEVERLEKAVVGKSGERSRGDIISL